MEDRPAQAVLSSRLVPDTYIHTYIHTYYYYYYYYYYSIYACAIAPPKIRLARAHLPDFVQKNALSVGGKKRSYLSAIAHAYGV